MNPDDYNSRPMAAPSSELTGDEIQLLQNYGYRDYDRERRVLILNDEGIRQFLSVFNDMKRRVKTLEKKVQTSIPMSHLANRAMSAFRRNPKEEEGNFQRTEDMLSTWSAANDDAGSDVLEKMNDFYVRTMDRLEQEEEHRWLLKNGQQTNYYGPIGQQIDRVGNINNSNNKEDGR